MGSLSRAVLLPLMLVLLAAAHAPVSGEHSNHHRYFVSGTVTDDLGNPLCGITVRAADITSPNGDGSDNRTGVTDGAGTYTIQLHMHDGDVADGATPSEQGNTILVMIEGTSVSRTVPATLNADNPEGWGEQTVGLAAPSGTQGGCGLGPLLLPIGIGVAVGVPVIAVVWLRRRPRASSGGALMAVPGMTRARARELAGFGVRSVKDLAAADPEELSKKTNLTPKEARLLVKRANESLKGR